LSEQQIVGRLIWTPIGGVEQVIPLLDWNEWPAICGKFPNFKPREFRCKDGSTDVVLHESMVRGVQQIRTLSGRPVNVTSAFRTVEWNRIEGGVEDSYHIHGMASDIVVLGLNTKQMATLAEQVLQFKKGGIGRYPRRGFLHVDVRDDGPGRWTH
jgi:uncharacterized protein YcbK (DUF882 family)